MAGRFFVTNSAVEDWLRGQHVVAPVGSPAWKLAERELIELVNHVADRKQPKEDRGQLVYKVGRQMIREVVPADHPFARWTDGAVVGSLEVYLHVTRSAQLVAVRTRSRAGRPLGRNR